MTADAERPGAADDEPASSAGRRWLLLVLAGYAVLLAVAVVGVRSPSTPNPLVPILKNDYAFHYAWGLRGAELLRSTGSIYGYDPHLLGGQLLTPHTDPSGNAGCYALALAPAGLEGLFFNLAAFAHLLALPFVAWLGARLFTRDLRAAAVSIAFAVVAWWTGFGAVCSSGGMYGFGSASVFGVALILLLAGARPPFGTSPTPWIAATGSLALLYHPGSLVICGPAIATFCIVRRRELSWRTAARTAGVLAVVLLVSAPWLIPWIANRGCVHDSGAGGLTTSEGGGLFQARTMAELFGDLVHEYARGSVLVAAFKLLLVGGAVLGWRRLPAPARAVLAVAAAGLAFLGFLGGFVPAFRGMEPYRFQTGLELSLSALAAGALAPSLVLRGASLRVAAACALCLPAALFGSRHAVPRLRLGLPGEIDAVVRVVGSLPPTRGRVLVQDALFPEDSVEAGKYLLNACLDIALRHATVATLLAHQNFPGREDYRFNGDRLFARAIHEYSPEELRSALAARGVSRVVAFTETSVAAFHGAGLSPEATSGRFVVLRHDERPEESLGTVPVVRDGRVVAAPGTTVLVNVLVDDAAVSRRAVPTLPWPQLAMPDDGAAVPLERLYAPWPGRPRRDAAR